MAGEKTLARSEYTFAVNASPGNELADSVRCQAWNSRLRSDVLVSVESVEVCEPN